MEIVFAARVGKRVADLKERVLVALVGLDGDIERVVSLGAVGNELGVRRQAAGSLRSHVSKHRIGRQNDLKRLRAGLRHRRAAGVVHKEALVHAELSVLCFDLQNVGVDGNSLNLGRHIVYRDIVRSAAPRHVSEIFGSLVRHADQVGIAARQIQRVVSLGVGGHVTHFAHARHRLNQHHSIARGRLAGSLVRHGASHSCGLRQCAGKQKTQRNNSRKVPSHFHFVSHSFIVQFVSSGSVITNH